MERLWNAEIDFILAQLGDRKSKITQRIEIKTREAASGGAKAKNSLNEEYRKLGVCNECIRKIKLM